MKTLEIKKYEVDLLIGGQLADKSFITKDKEEANDKYVELITEWSDPHYSKDVVVMMLCNKQPLHVVVIDNYNNR